ncbi:DUF4350 domain-containing protein [Arthrobacter sp. JSM 101049]|uniref:DUF4350 domain-containing protein n=1 Tax=Arthrobacter sp. JSM 101049 TaxID=929097 RepID=UPI003564D152
MTGTEPPRLPRREADGQRLLQAEAPEPGGATWRRRWRAGRLWVALAVLAGLAALYYGLSQGGADSRPLSPENPAPEGAQAVARVLQDHGVQVVQPAGFEAALSALRAANDRADGTATLLLDDDGAYLDQDQLAELAGAAPRAVLVTPGSRELRAFAPGIHPAGVVPDDAASPVDAGCPLAAVAETRQAAAGGKMYRAERGCFAYPTSAGTAFGYAVEGTTTVLGNPDYLANGQVLAFDHAPLALRTLGATGTLVWYQPTVADHVATGPAASPFELLPDWVGPALGWLMVVGVLAICWRARRDGPLVPEPLPVVVPASETAEGRARLYRDARALEAAAAALRSASLGRVAAHLRLGHGTTADAVVATAAAESGLPGPRLRRIYFPGRLGSEAALVAWARELHTVEKEIGIP